MKRIYNAETLPGFVWLANTKFSPAVAADAVFHLGIPSPLMHGFEVDDPLALGKRDRYIWMIRYHGSIWRTIWMDRTGNYATRKKQAYGVRLLRGGGGAEQAGDGNATTQSRAGVATIRISDTV